MNPNNLLFTLCLSLFFSVAVAQRVEKKLVLTFPDTLSIKLDRLSLHIDSGGNFCYYDCNGHSPVIVNNRVYGPFNEMKNNYESDLFYNVEGKSQYFVFEHEAMLHGPVDGKIEGAACNTKEHFAYTITKDDKVSYYIDGKHMITTDSRPCAQRWWCALSDNGNVIYTVRNRDWNYLFVKDRLIDSTRDDYGNLAVDDNYNYRYSLGKNIGTNCNVQFEAYKSNKQRTFCPVTIENNDYNIDSIYFYGNGNGVAYGLPRNNFRRADRGHMKIITQGRCKYYLRYTPKYIQYGYLVENFDTVTWIDVNGSVKKMNYADIYMPCMDSLGNYAFFGIRDYYLYRNINGVEQAQPLSRYGVRATPICIDANGNFICYYQTDDSVYVYENDRLFQACAVGQFGLVSERLLLQDVLSREETGQLSGFNVAEKCYVVYKNSLSLPILKPGSHYSRDTFVAGDIVAGKSTGRRYWLLQKTGERKYDLLINNRRVTLPQDLNFDTPLWFALTENYVLTDKQFIFYALDGNKIYSYKVTL